MTNAQQINLSNQLLQFSKGLLLADSSMSYFSEESKILVSIINDNKEVTSRYLECFESSFEDDVSSLIAFSEAFSEYSNLNSKISRTEIVVDGFNLYEDLVLGFTIAKKSLENIFLICKENQNLENKLINFNSNSVDEEEYGITYNPFKINGVLGFKNKFETFSNVYLTEMRNVIGNQIFSTIEDNVRVYFDNNYKPI